MTNFVYDNVALPDDKIDSSGGSDAVSNPTRRWSPNDANRVFSAIDDMRDILRGNLVSVASFGALGDGVTDDSAAFLAAIAAARTASGSVYGTIIAVPKGDYIFGTQLVVPNGVGLWSINGPTAARIKAANTFSGTSLITNENTDGTQEFMFLDGLLIDGNQAGGAVCSSAVVDLGSLFVNSFVRNCVIEHGSNVGLRLFANSTPGGMGPIYVENCWVSNCLGENVVCEETVANTGACAGVYFNHLTSENQGPGKAAIRLTGLGHATQWHLTNVHIEQGDATGRIGLQLDGASHVLVDGIQLLRGSGSATAGIQITNVVSNVGIQIRAVTNENLINPIISDLKNSVTIGAVNVPNYVTADVTYQGAPRFLPSSTTGAKSVAFQSSAGVDRAWFDDLGQLTGSSLNGAGLDVVGDVTNDRPLALINHAKTRVFAWFYPDASNLRFRYFTGGLDLLNFDSSAAMFVYGTSTFQFLSTFQSGIKGAGSAGAAPSTGTHARGEIVFNADPSAGGKVGWVCTAAGSPGTWKAFGVIDP